MSIFFHIHLSFFLSKEKHLCNDNYILYNHSLHFISFVLKLLSDIGIGGFWRDRLWENYTASSVYPGRGNIISSRCWLQHCLHSTPSYICHICCSSYIFWKRRKPWRNCWLPNSFGVKTLISNKIAILHYRSFTSAAGNTFSEVCVFPIYNTSVIIDSFRFLLTDLFSMHLCVVKWLSKFSCSLSIQNVYFAVFFRLVSFDLEIIWLQIIFVCAWSGLCYMPLALQYCRSCIPTLLERSNWFLQFCKKNSEIIKLIADWGPKFNRC